jgi:hypothetical protein
MYKHKVIPYLLMSMFIVSTAYCQEESESRLIKSINGAVVSTDAVGNIISIRKEDQQPMAFFVPDKAIITQQTHKIGLMDIGKSDSVTIQYYVSSSVKNIVVSIVDNDSVVNE